MGVAYEGGVVIFVCFFVVVCFVQLSIPFEKLPDAHLRICFRHVAKAEGNE